MCACVFVLLLQVNNRAYIMHTHVTHHGLKKPLLPLEHGCGVSVCVCVYVCVVITYSCITHFCFPTANSVNGHKLLSRGTKHSSLQHVLSRGQSLNYY